MRPRATDLPKFDAMLARLQQFTTLGLLAFATACAAVFAAQGAFGWALAAFGLTLFAYAIVLAVEFAMLVVANRDDPAPRATVRQLVGAWWGEVLTVPRVFYWQQPFRSQAEPDHLPPGARGKAGIVFVHGLVCNRGLWNPWLARLRQAGVPFVAVNLEPLFAPIDGYAPALEQAVQRLERATANRPLIVAHSMGGLVVRAWLDAYQAEARVRHVVTIGTPHRGTLLARFALTPNVRQMRPAAAWLLDLARRESDGRYTRFTCFYSHCDNIVLPASSATLPDADNRHVQGVAHVHLLRQEAVFAEVLRRVTCPAQPLPHQGS